MNVFRLVGDLSHLLAIIILFIKIWKTRSCAGISGRSQVLFALVYTTRYLDLFSNFVSLYNSVMKVTFIGASYATLYLIYVKFKATCDRNHDTFRIEFLVIPVVILALAVNHEFSPMEVLWTFSIYLESVAILPQLILVSKTWEAETIMLHYLFCMGSYRALYILNWVYRYYSQGFHDLIAIFAGVVQTVIYCNFFCLYIFRSGKFYACDFPGCDAAFKLNEDLCKHMYWHTGEKPYGCFIEGEKPRVSDFPSCDAALRQNIFVVTCPDTLAKNPMVALLKSGDSSSGFDNIAMIEKEKDEPGSILTDLSFQAPTSHYSTLAPAIPLPSCYSEVKPGCNDLPLLKQTSVEPPNTSYEPIAPITTPFPDAPVPSQPMHPIPPLWGYFVPSFPSQQQPSAGTNLSAYTPLVPSEMQPEQLKQIPQYVPEPPKEKGSIPPEHQVLQDIFEDLRVKCQQVSTDPQTQRKLDDVAMKLDDLYDKLRDNSLSNPVSHGLHQIVQAIMTSDYSAALAVLEQMVQNATNSEISGFIPSIQVLLQTAAQLNVFLQ